MIQAFVSLKPQQPSRTESGMRSFFEALQSAVFSQPTIFRTNADKDARPYNIDDICAAVMNPLCKFVVIRAEGEKFWQCTFLLPDKQGLGALFFDLQRAQNPRRLSPESLIEMFKKLYKTLSPRLIRIGDSDAREKLKSRHGLVMMPGFGRIEWLQIVAPEVYNEYYNASELIAAPGYQTDILEDGALFMRVYDDPNDWENEDNISQANFVPGFLAGISRTNANTSAETRDAIRDLERLWARAEKTAAKAYETLDAGNANAAELDAIQKTNTPAAPQYDIPVETGNIDPETMRKRSVIFARVKLEFSVKEENITFVADEGPCSVFLIHADKRLPFYASYQDLDHKVFLLNVLEDLSRFISANGCSVKEQFLTEIKRLIQTYYCFGASLLNSIDDLPADVIRDRRIPQLRNDFSPAAVSNINGNQSLTLWVYKPDTQTLETLVLNQFEEWPLAIEAKIQATDMENEPEKTAAAATAAETKTSTQETTTDTQKSESQETAPKNSIDDATKPLDDLLNAPVSAKPVAKKAAVAKKQNTAVAKKSNAAAVKAIVIVLVLVIVAYLVCVFALNGGNFDISGLLQQLVKK